MKSLKSDKALGEVIPNLALFLKRNMTRFADKSVYCEKKDGIYQGISWKSFYTDIITIAYNLEKLGFIKGDKMVIFSPNRLEMLEIELAVMVSGGIAVPIFAFFNGETAEQLIKHSDAKYLAVSGKIQLDKIKPVSDTSSVSSLKKIFVFDKFHSTEYEDTFTSKLISFNELLKITTPESPKEASGILHFDAVESDVCLNMYTSGTMGVPKCVQLSHRNILSQQAGLEKVWSLNQDDRFLSYLPWHHSFGGIFELFSSLYCGATLYLESSYGKDVNEILENWKFVQPTVFFSVPKVYQALIELIKQDKVAEKLFFHPELKFAFTAAAPLPKNISDEFAKRNIAVLEGWGLTETSPCCALTDPKVKRLPGVIGKSIPGVEIRIADDGELQVKGPNVMTSYYKNDAANKVAFTEDGWYCTGDVGEITPDGLKLLSRKDRIFKLTNGEKVVPTEMESLIQNRCHFITYAMVVGGGKEYPVAIIFPNKKAFNRSKNKLLPEDGCFCPSSMDELGKCLQGCLHNANCGLSQKFSKIKYAMLIDDELSIDKNTLTPSMKISSVRVMEAYKAHIENIYGADNSLKEEVYIIRLEADPVVEKKIA